MESCHQTQRVAAPSRGAAEPSRLHVAVASQGKVFGEAFSLDLVGLSGLPADMAVPGIAVFSRRAVPLAAWTRRAVGRLDLMQARLRSSDVGLSRSF